jgi:hypothetical protein
VAIASGLAAALAGRSELRVSPRPPLLSRSFWAWVSFAVLVLIPVSIYFYVFHGDWFLLYLVDMRRIPSALAMIGFAAMVVLGTGAFAFASVLIRSQRDSMAGGLTALFVVLAVAVVPAASERLSQVGSYAQYHGSFGLTPFASGPLMTGSLAMGAILLLGLAVLLGRLYLGSRRG